MSGSSRLSTRSLRRLWRPSTTHTRPDIPRVSADNEVHLNARVHMYAVTPLHYITLRHVTSRHVALQLYIGYIYPLSIITALSPHYHITSPHITSPHITSHHLTSHHITSHSITSPHITSHHITSPHISSYHITSHHIETNISIYWLYPLNPRISQIP